MNVTNISLARLYNCGNYEHLKVELTCGIKIDENPAAVMEEMLTVLDGMKPIPRPTFCENALRVRKQLEQPGRHAEFFSDDPHSHLLSVEDAKKLVNEHAEELAEYDKAVLARKRALMALNNQAGTTRETGDAPRHNYDYDESDSKFD